jgi:DNA-binding MarR family transcriptional regulator
MEKAGFITRKPHERDRRAHRVQLCETGRRTFEQAREIAIELQNQVLAALPPERRDCFLEELEIVADACAAAIEKPAKKK